MENRVLVTVLLTFLFFLPSAFAEGCIANQSKVEVLKDGAHYYEVTLTPKWREARVEAGPFLSEMRKKVEARGSSDPIQLFKRQLKHFEPKNIALSVIDNFIKGEFGRIRTAGCLEAALLDNHLANYHHNTEFAGVLMSKDGEFKVHVLTWGETAAVSKSAIFEDWIEEQILQGWKPLTHIHNHPFYEGEILNGLIMASDGDVKVYNDYAMRWGIQSAWITNGISTAKFKSEEFQRLSREWDVSTAHDKRFWR